MTTEEELMRIEAEFEAKGLFIEAAWQGFSQTVLLNDFSKSATEEMRAIFFAGAIATFTSLIGSGKVLPPKESVRRLKAVQNELNEWIERNAGEEPDSIH